MSSPNGKMSVDRSPGRKSNHSIETHRTRRSHRSRSRERDETRRRDSRERRSDRTRDRERRSRSQERSHRDRDRREHPRDKDHDRDRKVRNEERPRDRDRDRDREHRHRDDRERERGKDRDRERNIDRDDEGRDRRRKRDSLADDIPEYEDRTKRRRDGRESDLPRNTDFHPRSRESDRLLGRTPRDPRAEFDDTMRPPSDKSVEKDRPRQAPPNPPFRPDSEDGFNARRPPSPPPARRRASPVYESNPMDAQDPDEYKEDDSEARSVFVSQLAARMTARDLGYFFEEKLGEGSVMDSRIVTDRLSRRSKGIAYVEFRTVDHVEKALALSGTIVMGLPIMVQLTESERNRTHAGDGSLNLPPGVSGRHGTTLYVGSLHFNLTESDIKQVFEPFGELDFVDLHKDSVTGRSKGYAFIQYKRSEDAKMALEQMEGFELAGRQLRVNTVHEKGTAKYTQSDSLDESGGGNLNAASRQALMQKLARIDTPPAPQPIMRPSIPQAMTSRSVLLRNMFNPEEETERDWDKELGDDVKGECENKYGKVTSIKVEKESEGEIYLQFDAVDSAKKAIEGLNGRWFGGRLISAGFISDAILQAHR